MITILHGDNQVASRNALADMLEQFRAKSGEMLRLEAKTLTQISLESALGTSQLFGGDSLVVIEGLLSLLKSSAKEKLIDVVLAHGGKNGRVIVLWEGKTIPQTQRKKFLTAKIIPFKTSSSVFAWVDAIGYKPVGEQLRLLDNAEKTDGIELCFAMLCRQVRLLLQVKSGDTPKVVPFALSKLKNQAANVTVESLLKLHGELVKIDENQKTSGSPLTLRQQLDTTLLKL